MQELSTECKGRLGNDYSLILGYNTITEDNTNIVNILLRITLNNESSRVELIKNKSALKILLNDKEVARNDIFLDFSQKTYYNVSYTYKIKNIDTKILNIKGTLEAFDDSDYLKNTNISTNIILPKVKDDSYSISLSNIEYHKFSDFIVNISNDFDFIERKIDINPWEKTTRGFSIDKTERLQYIQIRGKKDNKYYYSNVIKLNPED